MKSVPEKQRPKLDPFIYNPNAGSFTEVYTQDTKESKPFALEALTVGIGC